MEQEIFRHVDMKPQLNYYIYVNTQQRNSLGTTEMFLMKQPSHELYIDVNTQSLACQTSTTVPQVFRLKLRLMCVPLETPRHDELDRKSSSPPTRSLGTDTVIEVESHWTGTVESEQP